MVSTPRARKVSRFILFQKTFSQKPLVSNKVYKRRLSQLFTNCNVSMGHPVVSTCLQSFKFSFDFKWYFILTAETFN